MPEENEVVPRADRAYAETRQLLAQRVRVADETVSRLRHWVNCQEKTLGALRRYLRRLERTPSQTDFVDQKLDALPENARAGASSADDDARGKGGVPA